MEFKKHQLENGLTLIGEVNKSAKSAAVGFFVRTGSRDEVKEINGVSHYLEHMLFKGTEKLSAFEVNEAFDKTGAEFNAFTSEENTVFYAKVLPEYLIEITKLWAEIMSYSPNNMFLACAGNFDWKKISKAAEQCCAGWEKQPVVRELEDYGGDTKSERISKANLAREHVCLMSRSVSAQDKRRFAASLLGVIVGDETGSRFFWELVDNALAETATMQFGPMDGTGIFCSYIRCSSENVSKVLDTVRGVFAKLSAKGVTEDELQKAKNKVLSALVIKNELPMGRLIDLGFNWVYSSQYRTIEDDIKSVKAVTVEDVGSLIKQYSPADFTEFHIGPEQSG